MAQQILDTAIEGVKLIQQFRADDDRGSFVKSFHRSSFSEAGIEFELAESFYSTSKKNVIRGMHFHNPPFDHAKIVFCTQGSILDVALDLRQASSTYGASPAGAKTNRRKRASASMQWPSCIGFASASRTTGAE